MIFAMLPSNTHDAMFKRKRNRLYSVETAVEIPLLCMIAIV